MSVPSLQDALILANLLGKYPGPIECKRLRYRYDLPTQLTRVEQARAGGATVRQVIGDENATMDAYANIAAYLFEAERLYKERIALLPFWQRYLKYVAFLPEPERMKAWFYSTTWGI